MPLCSRLTVTYFTLESARGHHQIPADQGERGGVARASLLDWIDLMEVHGNNVEASFSTAESPSLRPDLTCRCGLVTAYASRSNECEARANFHETFYEGDVQANSTDLKIRADRFAVFRRLAPPQSFSRPSSQIACTRGDLAGDHGNRRRITLWNFGREPQIRTVLWSHTDPKTLRICAFFRTILRKSHIGETGVWSRRDLNP
jgi:hypothetical protein